MGENEMRRLIMRIATIVLLAVVVGIGWFGEKKQSLSQTSPPSDFTPPIFTLQVNRQDNVDTVQGAPLIFTVFLSSSKSANPLRIGKPGNPWHAHVRLELVEGKPLTWKLAMLGSPQAFLFQRDASGRINIEGKEGEEAIIDAEHSYTVELGIDPDESAKITPGLYTIQAILDISFERENKRVASNPVIVNVQEQKVPLTAEQELRRLIESAEFYIQASRFEDAYLLAIKVKEREPKKIQSYILLGDALNGLRRDKEALEAYNYAIHLSALEKQYEPPTYLMLRKYEVEQRLGKQ